MAFEVYILTKQDMWLEEETFVEVFGEQPSTQQLSDYGVPTAYIDHVMKGGNKIGCDQVWFYLRKRTLTTSADKVYDRMFQSDGGA